MQLTTAHLVDLGTIALAILGMWLIFKRSRQLGGSGAARAFPMAPLQLTAGVASAIGHRFPWMRRAYRQRADRKLMLTAAVTLLLASSLTALFTALDMADHEGQRLTRSMENDRDALVQSLLMSMEVHGKELQRFSQNPMLVRTLQSVQDGRAGSIAQPSQALKTRLDDLRIMMDLLAPHDYAITNQWGATVLSRETATGHHPGLPSLAASLSFPGQTFLQRDSTTLDFDLHLQLPIVDGAHTIGHFSGLIVQLREMGVNTSIDDFGTGYSSLASLKRLPVTTLKLDRAFVKDLPFDADDAAITRAVMSMAQALHMNVVVEGVETQEQADFLRHLGCEAYQGWLFSPAVPPKRFADFLADAQPAALPLTSP